MTTLADFPITHKWPATQPERIQLYSLPTPNGVKVSIMLEETGLPYEPHLVSFDSNDQMSPEFLSLNPNNKIPAILDPNGPDGKPLALFESGAILVYLADKAGQFITHSVAGRYETLQWVMFQMGGVGPMFGQLGFFHKFAGKEYDDKRPRDRYVAETRRLLGVLDKRVDHGRRVHHRRHRHLPVGAQPDRLLRRRGAGELRGVQGSAPGAGRVRGPTGGGAGAEHSGATGRLNRRHVLSAACPGREGPAGPRR